MIEWYARESFFNILACMHFVLTTSVGIAAPVVEDTPGSGKEN